MKRLLALFASAPALLALATVNVNTAQQSELQLSKGLDKHKAKAIIEWRAQNGTINNFAELQQVPGFTLEVIEKAKPEITFRGDAYVPAPKAEKKKK